MAALLAYLITVTVALLLAHRLAFPLRRLEAALLALAPLPFAGIALVTGAVYAPADFPYAAEPLRSLAPQYGITGTYNGHLSDLYTQMMPWRAAVRHAYENGWWPHLNPFMLAGDVLAGSAQPAPYHPLNLISLLLPMGGAVTYVTVVALFVSALGAHLWLRELGCRPLAAGVGAFAWMACDFVLFWIGWPIGVTASALPWLMFAVARVVAIPSLRRALFLCTVFVWLLLAGHPETVLHHVAVGAAFGLWRLRELPRAARLRPILLCTLAGALALAMTAIAILPFAEAIEETFESQYRREIWAYGKKSVSWDGAWHAALPSILPFAYGRSAGEHADIEDANLLIPSTAWAGTIVLALAWLGLMRGRRRDRTFLIGMLVAGLWIGTEAPGLTDLLGSLPLFSITLNERLILLAAFALSTFAGLGAQAHLERPRRMTLALTLGGAAVFVGLLALLLWPTMRNSGLPNGFLLRQTLMIVLPAAVAALGVLGLRRATAGLAIVLGLLVVERSIHSRFYPAVPSTAFYPPFPGLEKMRSGDEPWRVVGRSYNLLPSTAALYRLEDPRGYQAMTNTRLRETFDFWSHPMPVWFNRVDDLTSPFLAMINVRWAIDNVESPVPEGWRVIESYAGYRILEKERPLARAFIPRTIVTTGSRRPESMRTVEDFSEVSWIGPPLGQEREDHDSHPAPNGRGELTVTYDGPDLRVEALMEEAGWVIVSQTGWKGWRAVDARGREIPLHYGNHAFLAFPLDRGRHIVRLEYEPESFPLAVVLTASGWGMFLLLFVGAARRHGWRSGRAVEDHTAAA